MGGIMDEMSRDELIKVSIEEFSRLQTYMKLTDESSSVYDLMFTRYIELKVFLTSAGVNLSQLDRVSK